MSDPQPAVRSRRPIHRAARRLFGRGGLALAVLLLSAGPLAAYTIYLKDGSRILAKEKYEIVGDKAYITLPSGTRSVIDAAEIDVARSDKANEVDIGTAMVIEDGAVKDMAKREPPPRRKTLADLMAEREAAPRELPGARRQPVVREPETESFTRTSSGAIDLLSIPRRPFANIEISSALAQLFHSQGIDQVEIYQGSVNGRPLVDVTANSEASVFRALAVTASALLRLRDRFPGRLDSIELLMTTPTRERAGQFLLTPVNAHELMSKQVDIQTFYLANLQF